MNNKYIVFLLWLCAALIAAIGVIQINALSIRTIPGGEALPEIYLRLRASETATLFLALAGIAILFAREGITRELKRKAYTDVTGIRNKHACLEEMTILDCNDNTLNIGFAMFDMNNLKKVNDFYGHEKGDELIQSFASLLKQASEKKFFLGRFGGDEFIVIIRSCTNEIMEDYINRVRQLADLYNRGRSVPLSFASGYAISTRNHYYLMEDLLKEADKNMYRNKKLMKSDSLMTPSQLSRILDAERTYFLGRDDLTGLFNYDAFVAAVKKFLPLSENLDHLAVICCDISNFRYINDTYGHQEGNQILKTFAKELSSQPFCLCACRLYSDNFAFLAELPDASEQASPELIKEWCLRFSSMINQAYKGGRIIINSGIYFIGEGNVSIENALNYANTARKHTKTSTLNILVYGDALAQEERNKAEILNSFHNALDNGEYQVYLQPMVRSADKSICKAEALIRWRKPNGAFFYPGEFIPLLEESGDIIRMDYFVYEHIFEYLYIQIQNHKPVIPISMNVSRLHLCSPEDFIRHIRELLEKYPIPTSLIVFELTESTFIKEMSSALYFVEELHRLGIKVSMDDFGSGYSSLEVLVNLPFDEIKFDKAFLSNSGDKRIQSVLVQMMSLVKGLDKTIVCEGVELSEHAALLEKCDCDIIQGYYYYRPMPLEDFISCIGQSAGSWDVQVYAQQGCSAKNQLL